MKEKKKRTKLWGLLLFLMLALGMMPTTALATGSRSATGTADFTTNANAALVLLNAAKTGEEVSTWDSKTNTLTLNGVNFETSAPTAVKLPTGSTIFLAEGTTNTIKGGDSSKTCLGIHAMNNLTISGSGTLSVTGGNATDDFSSSYGILSDKGNVTISDSAKVIVNSGTADWSSCGIISDGSVTISDSANVTAKGGNANSFSRGIYARYDINISGGNVKAESGNTYDRCYGIYTAYGDVSITAGIVKAIGGNVSKESYGIYASSGDGDVTITGGILIAKANNSAMNKAPSMLPSAYQWRISESGDYSAYPGSAYTWDVTHTYLDIRKTAPIIVSYTVFFDANGGTGTMANVTGVSGDYTLPANGFTAPAGKQFKCWNVGGAEKAVGGKITVTTNTTLYAIWEDIPVKEYGITVTDGKATSSTGTEINQATAGMTVTLTANTAASGNVFDKWEIVSGGITLADASSATTTFTMPAGAVSVKATYKKTAPVPAAKGKVLTDKQGNRYKVTKSDAKAGEVTFAKPKSGVKGTVKIPNTVTIDGITYKVTAIGANAFKNKKNISKVIIGNNVKVIGKNAFSGCKKIISVTVGKKVKTISAGAFSGCAKLTTVNLGAAVTTIGDKAFYKCTSLTGITISAKITKIGTSAFEGCKKLKTITVKTTKLKSVGKRTLKGIHAKAKIKVPKSKLTKYKSLFKNKGQGKNVKVVK